VDGGSRPDVLSHGVRLTIAYDGTEHSGWQYQPAQRTVQGELEAALDAMRVRHGRVRGCSRTDAGVHAEGQVAAVAVDREISERGWPLALNALLPDDVAVVAAKACDRRYQPRFDAAGKLYRYLIHTGPHRDPISRRRAWHVGPQLARRDVRPRRRVVEDYLDLEAMRDAARRLEGEHEFQAFRASTDDREHTRRTMRAVRVLDGFGGRPEMLALEVEGDAFMKNMVRIMAGTLVEVGRQRMTPADVSALLSADARRHDGGMTAPAHGLTLVRIDLRHGDWTKKRR